MPAYNTSGYTQDRPVISKEHRTVLHITTWVIRRTVS